MRRAWSRPPSVTALIARIDDATGGMRSTLHDAIVAFGAPAVAPLSAMLRAAEKSLATKVELVEILGSIGGAAVMAPLAEALQNDAWELRFAAVNALRRQSDVVTASTLAPATHDVHPRVRLLATRAIQDLT